MPSADFCPAVRLPLGNLSRHSDTEHISCGKLNRLPCAVAESTRRTFMDTDFAVWLPSYAEILVSARLLLLKTLKANAIVRYTDYKKFRVESVIEPESVTPN